MGLEYALGRIVSEQRVKSALGPSGHAAEGSHAKTQAVDKAEQERLCYNDLNEKTPMPQASAVEKMTGQFQKKLEKRREAITSQCMAPTRPSGNNI